MKKENEMKLRSMKNQLTNALLKQAKGFQLNLNDTEGVRYSAGVNINSIYFSSCKIFGYNPSFCFSNENEEPAIQDGKEIFTLHYGESFFINIEQVKSIKELEIYESIDRFNLPCNRIFQVEMAEGDLITIGLL